MGDGGWNENKGTEEDVELKLENRRLKMEVEHKTICGEPKERKI